MEGFCCDECLVTDEKMYYKTSHHQHVVIQIFFILEVMKVINNYKIVILFSKSKKINVG